MTDQEIKIVLECLLKGKNANRPTCPIGKGHGEQRFACIDELLAEVNRRIAALKAENAALHERLEKAVELPCIERMTTYEWNDETGVGHPIQGWQVLYRDKTGEFFAEPVLDEEEAKARLKELQGAEG